MAIRKRDRTLCARLRAELVRAEQDGLALTGIAEERSRDVLVRQLLESVHRVSYVRAISRRDISPRRADPQDLLFDPIKAAILHQRQGNLEEAFWLVFLFVHFGKHLRGGWRYVREVYGGLGRQPHWTWACVTLDPDQFRTWLAENQDYIGRKSDAGGFGNHRKYQSLDAWSPQGTGAAVASYVGWVEGAGDHQRLFAEAIEQADGDPKEAFRLLFQSMNVAQFGRTAKFDYLAMVGKLGLARLEPDSAYFVGPDGPTAGARLLFGGNKRAPIGIAELEALAKKLDVRLQVGMQAIEDALCNWQKTPEQFRAFRG